MVEYVIFPRAMQFKFRGGTQLPFRADLKKKKTWNFLSRFSTEFLVSVFRQKYAV